MAATIKDIARTLRISTSTVSYALNGGPRTVPAEVRDRVLETAKALGYRPNRIARSMITGRTNTYGVVPTEVSINLARSPYSQLVLNGILNAAEVMRRDVLIFTGFDQRKGELFADTLLDGRVDGVIFMAPPNENPIFAHLEEAEFPYVVTSTERYPNVPAFTCDNVGGVRAALAHLYELGHRRIATLYGKPWLDEGELRLQTFRKFMKDHELEVPPEWIMDGDFTQNTGYEAAEKLLSLSNLPTAVFCANDEMALGFLRAATDRGVSIPKQISLVGFDDSPFAFGVTPSLTTVRQPLEEMGAAAIQALEALREGQPASNRTFSTRLMVRATTSSPPEDK